MKLHLGCGKRYLDGFVHVDLAEFDHVDFITTLGNLEMIDAESVDEIYSSHAFEYYDRFAGLEVLKEWRRVLKWGGKIFLTVPDFDQLISIYAETKDLSKVIGPLFGRWDINQSFHYHKTVYNFTTLRNSLSEVGFREIKRFDPTEYLSSIDPNFDDHSLAFYPHMDKNGIPVSLAISALK